MKGGLFFDQLSECKFLKVGHKLRIEINKLRIEINKLRIEINKLHIEIKEQID
jgi:hypothetical protein